MRLFVYGTYSNVLPEVHELLHGLPYVEVELPDGRLVDGLKGVEEIYSGNIKDELPVLPDVLHRTTPSPVLHAGGALTKDLVELEVEEPEEGQLDLVPLLLEGAEHLVDHTH